MKRTSVSDSGQETSGLITPAWPAPPALKITHGNTAEEPAENMQDVSQPAVPT